MQNILSLIEKDRNIRKRMTIILCILSVFALGLTLALLIRPAHSLVNKADCGITEHTHTPECYSEHKKCGESVLVCCSDLLPEKLSHIHNDFCYDENGKIICPLSEYEHIHTDECYDENGVQICGTAFHQHGEECFHILNENESALVLECGKVSHAHYEPCLTSQEDMQEDFAEPQNIESDFFEEAEIIEPETEIFEPENNNQIAVLSTEGTNVDASNGLPLPEKNISSVKLEYKNEKGVWVTVTNGMENVPANASMRINVDYKDVDKTAIIAHNNQIVYSGIPAWLNPNSTGDIYDENGTVVASLSAGGGNAVITFKQDYLKGDGTIKGSFSVEGSADWREINNPSTSNDFPDLKLNFTFEGDLSSKYGNFEVTKNNTELVEVRENGKIAHTYLKYELKVKSRESDINIPEICITDILSTEKWLNLNDVIEGNGYVGVNGTKTNLENSSNNYEPYETVTGVENYSHGTVILDNNNLKWNIDNLQPQEERTLVYYVELNEKYVGSGSAGTLQNEAIPESKGFKKKSVRDEFTPKAEVNITKTQDWDNVNINEYGNGTIKYTITVTAASDNSYTITDALIKDSFRDGMADYVEKVTLNTKEGDAIPIVDKGFTISVNELKADESVEIIYYVHVKNIYSKTNGDVSLSNHASFVSKDNTGKIKQGYTFKGHGVTTTIAHNQWTRKLEGKTVTENETISITKGNVYNYCDNIDDTPTQQTDVTGFTVPQNAREYTVIVNEDGTWNMSGTQFKDEFSDDRIVYTGYLKIEEFNQISDIKVANKLSDSAVLTELNKHTPTNTVWVNIDGLSKFEVIPTKYGLTDDKRVYRLTYYAAVKPTETNIKNIVVANDFSITGTIGIGDNAIIFNGVHMTVSSTLTGSASYDFDKESLFHEKKPNTTGNGGIYWVIRANGKLPEGLHIKDEPEKSTINSDSLVGVYMGDKGYDFSKITSSEELDNALSGMEKLEGGICRYFYNLQTITSYADLNGKDFAIFSRGGNRSGYLTGNQNGNNKIKGESLDTRVTFGTEVETNEIVQTWHFELAPNETDKFYIYYTDSSNNNHYMHISTRSATISDTPEPLTVSIKNNQVKIANPDAKDEWNVGAALNWYGDNGSDIYYSSWKNVDNDANNWHYLGTLDNSTRYIYEPQTISSTNELDGKQFAIVTPGTDNSGLLVGGEYDQNALNGIWYTDRFTNLPFTITRTSPLQKWTFKKIEETFDETDGTDEFQVYYTENNKNYYLKLGEVVNNQGLATTTETPVTVRISCQNGKIKIKTVVDSIPYALDWCGGGQDAQTLKPYYSTWNDSQSNDNRLHYVVKEDIISAGGTSDYAYSWNNKGSIRITKEQDIPQDKSMYIIIRTQPDKKLEGDFPITFDNEVGIMDDLSGQFDKLDGASYKYNPNLPLKKEGMVAVYYNATESGEDKQWTIYSVNKNHPRNTGSNLWNPKVNSVFSNEKEIVKKNGSGLYVEWLMNVNWDGTLDGKVILTDYLNHKMEPVLLRQFNLGNSINNKTYAGPDYDTIPELENNPDWTKLQTHEMPFYYNAKTGELKVAVGNLQKTNTAHEVEVNLQLICRVTDPAVIFSGDISILTNNAELTRPEGTFISNHEVTHEINSAYSISKEGTGTTVGEGTNKHYVSNKLTYEIEINPLAEDLMFDKDTLPVLIDEMSDNMELVGTVDIYEKSGDSETKLDIGYSIVDIENEHKKQIIFENLPDNKHLIISYKTKVNVTPNNTANISNKAYWQGYNKPTAPQYSKEFSYNLSGLVSSEKKSNPIVVINKLDLYDNSITLSGAEFEIRKINTDGNVNTSSEPIKTTTDKDGKIRFDDDLDWNTVYQIKETKAPTDYVLDSTPQYFMVANQENTGYTINDGKMTVDGKTVDVIIDYGVEGNSTDLDLTIYNEKARIEVKKVFHNELDGEANPRYGTYRFGLYEKPANANSTDKPVQILSITYSDKGESYALDGKATTEPVFTKAKAGALNYVYELNEKYEPISNGSSAFLNGYSFDVTYSNNIVFGKSTETNGTDVPVVTITNKEHPIYLPMTGGIGFKKYYLTAFYLSLILLALATVIVKIRRKCK